MEAFTELGQAVGGSGVPMTGAPFLIMHGVIDEEADGDIELAFPVAAPFPGEGAVRGRELAATTVAWTLHRGPYDEVPRTRRSRAGSRSGARDRRTTREVYLTDPQETPDPADYFTEIQFPIR